MTARFVSRDEPSTNPSLLRRAQSGQAESWQKLVQIYGPIIYRWIRHCGVQSADAADVMQETLIAVAGALPRFDPNATNSRFRGWLWTIARNKLRDRQRQLRRSPIDDDSLARAQLDANVAPPHWVESDDPPSDLANDNARTRRLALELMRNSFAPKTWRMFWETVVEDRDPSDVAKDLEVSRWTVYKARARVLQKLRQELDGLVG
ncbi:MAG: sigma-70 family RNA polymerase sigma factor [Planctomycetota bacterium]